MGETRETLIEVKTRRKSREVPSERERNPVVASRLGEGKVWLLPLKEREHRDPTSAIPLPPGGVTSPWTLPRTEPLLRHHHITHEAAPGTGGLWWGFSLPQAQTKPPLVSGLREGHPSQCWPDRAPLVLASLQGKISLPHPKNLCTRLSWGRGFARGVPCKCF